MQLYRDGTQPDEGGKYVIKINPRGIGQLEDYLGDTREGNPQKARIDTTFLHRTVNSGNEGVVRAYGCEIESHLNLANYMLKVHPDSFHQVGKVLSDASRLASRMSSAIHNLREKGFVLGQEYGVLTTAYNLNRLSNVALHQPPIPYNAPNG